MRLYLINPSNPLVSIAKVTISVADDEEPLSLAAKAGCRGLFIGFESMPRILRRVWGNFWGRRQPLISLVGNLSYRKHHDLSTESYVACRRSLAVAGACAVGRP